VFDTALSIVVYSWTVRCLTLQRAKGFPVLETESLQTLWILDSLEPVCGSVHRHALPEAREYFGQCARLDCLQHVVGPRDSDRLRLREPSLHQLLNLREDWRTFSDAYRNPASAALS
jgi:hypothetical protein